MSRFSISSLRVFATAALILSFANGAVAQAPATGAQIPPKATSEKPSSKASTTTAAPEDADAAAARQAALAWLAVLDAGRFDATWDEAATSFQKAQKKADWSKGLGAARASMGKVLSRTLLNQEVRMTLPDLPNAKYITVRFKTVFEKNKAGAESVTVVRDGARGLRMMSYFLQ